MADDIDFRLGLGIDHGPSFSFESTYTSGRLAFYRRHFLYRLNKLLAKHIVSIKKADEIQVKVNVLSAFVEGPQEDGEEKIRDTAEL